MTADPAVRPNPAQGVNRYLDDRLGTQGFLRRSMNKVFPDHWSFLLGEIALYSFVILLLTGTYLTFFFHASGNEVIYNGSYVPLKGVPMSEAYKSTLDISFDVRAGLVFRQIHHWAALLFMASIVMHLLRVFFTGAFRKPREINWLIGVGLLTLGLVEGFAGYSLPDDLLSGTGLRIAASIAQSIPVIGTYRRGVSRYRHHRTAVRDPHLAGSGHHPGLDHRPHGLDVAPEAHPVPGPWPHREQRGGSPLLPRLHPQDQWFLRVGLRDARAPRRARPDQPDLAVRPVQPGERQRSVPT
jgi:hypothetical protein